MLIYIYCEALYYRGDKLWWEMKCGGFDERQVTALHFTNPHNNSTYMRGNTYKQHTILIFSLILFLLFFNYIINLLNIAIRNSFEVRVETKQILILEFWFDLNGCYY